MTETDVVRAIETHGIRNCRITVVGEQYGVCCEVFGLKGDGIACGGTDDCRDVNILCIGTCTDLEGHRPYHATTDKRSDCGCEVIKVRVCTTDGIVAIQCRIKPGLEGGVIVIDGIAESVWQAGPCLDGIGAVCQEGEVTDGDGI